MSQLPAELQAALLRLRSFQSPMAQQWMPDMVEVMVWPYDYAPEDSIHWPENWPGLDDPMTELRGEDTYSIFIPADDFAELTAFLETRRQRGAIEIDGHKFAASLRFPFPGEQHWMAVNPDEPSGN